MTMTLLTHWDGSESGSAGIFVNVKLHCQQQADPILGKLDDHNSPIAILCSVCHSNTELCSTPEQTIYCSLAR